MGKEFINKVFVSARLESRGHGGKNDKKSLDEYEDYPYLYDCFDEKVLLENNETITGFIYQMYDRFPICKPSDSYMERCKQGYRDMGWDASILDF